MVNVLLTFGSSHTEILNKAASGTVSSKHTHTHQHNISLSPLNEHIIIWQKRHSHNCFPPSTNPLLITLFPQSHAGQSRTLEQLGLLHTDLREREREGWKFVLLLYRGVTEQKEKAIRSRIFSTIPILPLPVPTLNLCLWILVSSEWFALSKVHLFHLNTHMVFLKGTKHECQSISFIKCKCSIIRPV